MTWPIHWRTWASGMAPRKPSTTWPPTTAMTIGMLWTCSAARSCGFASMSTLASTHAPSASMASFSRTGLSCLHGPHHSAHRSRITGADRDRSTTSYVEGFLVHIDDVAGLRAVRPVNARRRLLAALRGCLPRAQVDGAVERKVPRLLHDSILPHARHASTAETVGMWAAIDLNSGTHRRSAQQGGGRAAPDAARDRRDTSRLGTGHPARTHRVRGLRQAAARRGQGRRTAHREPGMSRSQNAGVSE